MHVRLVFLSGSLSGTTCDVPESGATLGRSPDCTVRFEQADGMVSGHHARLFVRDGQVLIEDDRSTNGTFVDGGAVTTSRIQPGQVIMLGKGGPSARVEFSTELETPETIVSGAPHASDTENTKARSEPSTLTGLFHLARERATNDASGNPPDQTAVVKAFVRLAQEQASRKFSRRLAVVAGLALVAVVIVYALGEREAANLRGQLTPRYKHSWPSWRRPPRPSGSRSTTSTPRFARTTRRLRRSDSASSNSETSSSRIVDSAQRSRSSSLPASG
jgi:pSer/pThr/pTyr-binding forkhead associated (FHA) protein